jgi:protein TonB
MLALRFPFAASSGVLVTLAVFSLLWHFVSVPIDIPEVLPTVKVDWKRLRNDTPFEVRRDERIERPDPPRIPDRPPGLSGETVGTATPYLPPGPVHVVVEKTRGFVMGEDRDVIPIVRVNPDYPQSAIDRNLEGWVQVQFTVTTIGTVRDAIVVAAEPRKTFDDAALKAIARWRYNPKVENGVAVERVGLQTVIRFQLEH